MSCLLRRLKPLIKWPGREELQKTLPLDFRAHFKKCVVIIDCFEIFCERPKSLKARAQTYSNYEHHNTVKFLIGIAPQGSITFISKGWSGRVSDQYLTENCGILDQLLPGDQYKHTDLCIYMILSIYLHPNLSPLQHKYLHILPTVWTIPISTRDILNFETIDVKPAN